MRSRPILSQLIVDGSRVRTWQDRLAAEISDVLNALDSLTRWPPSVTNGDSAGGVTNAEADVLPGRAGILDRVNGPRT